MGHRLTDGKAVDVTAPAATVINDGDLYRIGNWSGFAIGKKDGVQTDLGMALETDKNAVWKVKFPAGLAPAVGDFVYWTTGAGFKKGDTDLQAAVQGQPVAQVLIAKNAAGYAAVRLTGLV